MGALGNINAVFSMLQQPLSVERWLSADLRGNVMLMSLGLDKAKYLLSSVSPR